ncbi:MAG: hypothetical protein L3J81_02935, partial [Thermoplasmata archaeon]|nr:hypothetical protein [Thermoplasmata archaeon]
MRPPTVIFQVTAIGKNPRALAASVGSVLHWLRHTPRLTYRALVWLVIEPDGYATAPALYDSIRRGGVRLLIVPKEYATPLGTTGKARALQYACEVRRHLGLSGPTVWTYHQDEETCVGEDTLQGIASFVRQTDRFVGTGVILYPLDWTGSPSHV